MSKKIIGTTGVVISGSLFTLCAIPFGFSLFKIIFEPNDTPEKRYAYKVVAFTTIVPPSLLAGSIYLLHH